MLHIYLNENCDVISVDEREGVTLNYENKIVKIPYEEWKEIQEHVLSYFKFRLEKGIKQYGDEKDL